MVWYGVAWHDMAWYQCFTRGFLRIHYIFIILGLLGLLVLLHVDVGEAFSFWKAEVVRVDGRVG